MILVTASKLRLMDSIERGRRRRQEVSFASEKERRERERERRKRKTNQWIHFFRSDR